MKYPNITFGRVEAVWNKLGGEDGVDKFLRGELSVSEPTRSWREQNGVIYFSVTSDGTTGEEDWVSRLEGNGFHVLSDARRVLRSSDFKPTSGVVTEVAVLKGMLFKDDDRITKNIRAEANERRFEKLNAEVACLIREKFTDKDIKAMGLRWIFVMHQPVKNSDASPDLLCVGRGGDGQLLSAHGDWPGNKWHRDLGFAFAVSKVSSQSQDTRDFSPFGA